MIQVQVKLRLTGVQERKLLRWMFHLTGVWNWAIQKIESTAKDGIRLKGEKWVKGYYGDLEFKGLLSGHSEKMGVPAHVLQAMLGQAHLAWVRCFKGIAKPPHRTARACGTA